MDPALNHRTPDGHEPAFRSEWRRLRQPGTKILYHNGQEYQTVLTREGLVIHKRKGDLLVPVAALGSLGQGNGDGTGLTIWDSDLGYRLVENFYPPFFAGHVGDNNIWTDGNSDGLVQPGELQWLKALAGNDAFTPGTQPLASTLWVSALRTIGRFTGLELIRTRQLSSE